MRFDIIRQPLGLTFLLVAGFLGLCWARDAGYPLPGEEVAGALGPLGAWVDGWHTPHGWVFDVLVVIVLFVSAFYVTRIVTRNMVLVVRTYLPALFYVMVACGFFRSGAGLVAALASFLLIAGSEQMIAGFQRRPTYGRFFKASLLLGAAPLLYAPAVIWFAALLAGLLFFRRGWRETVIALFGYFLPLAVGSYIDWMAENPIGRLLRESVNPLTNATGFSLFHPLELPQLAVLGLFAALTVLSLVTFALYAKQTRTRARKIFSYFTFLLLVSLVLFFLPSSSPADFILLAAPVAVIAPNYFVRYSGLVPGLLYLLILLGMIGINLAPLLGF